MQAYPQLKQQLYDNGIDCREAEPLKNHTTFCIGGPADIFCRPTDMAQLAVVLLACRQNKVAYFLLGCGSNLLFNDNGFRGVVIALDALDAIRVEGDFLVAETGAKLADVCAVARDNSLTGLEFAYGIPGSVGGAVFMDAGAYGGEIQQVLHSVDFLNEELVIQTLPVNQLEMCYRGSVFQTKQWCITAARFLLAPGNKQAISEIMDGFMAQRECKQPLTLPSAGSAFKRPVGAFAGALIDQSGLRGYRIGDAAISEKHCGFIVNLGNATCKQVLELADYVVDTVKDKTGFQLEKEIRVVGEGQP